MKNTINIKNIIIGEGTPKICLPIIEQTSENIISAAKAIDNLSYDIVEWRVDWFEHFSDTDKVLQVLHSLNDALSDKPILFTFRSLQEGGKQSISQSNYEALIKTAITSGLVDMIDIELSVGEDIVKNIINIAHENNVIAIVSSHDFKKTPDKETIVSKLQKMQILGADIPKIAVMPNSKQDVLTLLSATEEMATNYADRPIITMSMDKTGVISRLCGEVFGSSVTFGSVQKASAPGQINVSDLSTILNIIHKSIN